MIFNIKFAGHTHADLGSGEIVRKFNDGKEKVEGVYSKTHGPDTMSTVRVKTNGSNKVYIDMEQEELTKIVPLFGLVNRDEKLIMDANKNFALDDFWLNNELMFDIKHSGAKINDEDHDGKFWLSVFKADPEFYVDVPGSKRPENMSKVRFVVVPEKFDTGGLSEISKNYVDNYDVYRALINMPRTTKMYILDAIDKPKEYNNETDDKELDKLILGHLDNYRSRIYTNETFKDFFARTIALNPAELEIGFLVKLALNAGMITKNGDQWYYEGNTLGISIKDAEGVLARKDYKKVLASMLGALKEKGLY